MSVNPQWRLRSDQADVSLSSFKINKTAGDLAPRANLSTRCSRPPQPEAILQLLWKTRRGRCASPHEWLKS